jgi:transposase-like protein
MTTTISLDALADRTYHCEMCGCETSRLFDGDCCAVCHFGYVQHRETSIHTALHLLGQAVRATLSEGVHPDDVRRVVDVELNDPPSLVYEHVDDITERLKAITTASARSSLETSTTRPMALTWLARTRSGPTGSG